MSAESDAAIFRTHSIAIAPKNPAASAMSEAILMVSASGLRIRAIPPNATRMRTSFLIEKASPRIGGARSATHIGNVLKSTDALPISTFIMA